MYYFTEITCPIRPLTALSDGKYLKGLWLAGQRYHCLDDFPGAVRRDELPLFDSLRGWLGRYFGGGRPGCRELPLAPEGSEFRRKIWDYLCDIPWGETVTYGDLAKRAAQSMGISRMSAQAVGGAVGHNPISIIIPCHRVIGADGGLTGYGGGLDVKRRLLDIEGAYYDKRRI